MYSPRKALASLAPSVRM